MANAIQNLISGRKKAPKPVAASTRLTFPVGIGTTGKKAVVVLEAVVPTMRGCTIGIDGEITRQELLESENLIAIPDMPIADYLAKIEHNRVLRADPFLRSIRFPYDLERGAGMSRPVGILKGAVIFDQIRQKATRLLHRGLANLENPGQRLLIDIHLIAAAGGGFGGALLVFIAMILRDVVRRVSPGARCNVVAHLFTAEHFENRIADEEIRTKVRANDFACFLELDWAQDPEHVAKLYELLGCQPLMVPTFDRVIPYGIGNERGSTLALEHVIRDRLIPNILAGENAGVANRLRELASNTAARDAGLRRTMAHPMVSICQAAAVLVPPQLAACWSSRETIKELTASLAKPSTERLKHFEASARTTLGLENIKTEVARICGEPLADVLTTAKTTRQKTPAQAHAGLNETYTRYFSSIRPSIESKSRTFAQHQADVAIPETIANVCNALLERGATLAEVIVSLRQLTAHLVDFGERVEKEAEKSAALVKARRDEFHSHMQVISSKASGGRQREQAATSLNETIQADSQLLRHRTLRLVVRHLNQALSDTTHELAAIHREAVKGVSALKRRYQEFRELATMQSTTFRSVVQPAELDEVLKRIDSGVRAFAESVPALDTKNLIGDGQLGVADRIDAHVKSLTALFDGYFESTLVDVAGTAKALRLSFSMSNWIDSTIRDLACCSPLRMDVTGNVEPQTMVVAFGDDLEAVKQSLARRPTLAQLEAIPGTDPRCVMIHRRVDGLTVEAITSFADSRRAAGTFPMPKPGLSSWEALISSGHLLGAYEQAGLVPSEWATAKRLPGRRPAAESAASSNGDASLGRTDERFGK